MNEKEIKRLLQRYDEDQLTLEEKNRLYAYYNRVLKENSMDSFDETIAEDKLDQWSINESVIEKRETKIKLLNPWVWAACIIPLIGVFYFMLNSIHKESEELPLTNLESIAAPVNKAVLTLPDGSRVVLDEDSIDMGRLTEPMLDNFPKEQSIFVETSNGGKLDFILPDGTHVWLNSGSKLNYSVAFGHDNRDIELEGEAYFEVSKIKTSGGFVPFKVKTKSKEIKVLGTKFNINSYANEPQSKTTLLEGVVVVQSSLPGGGTHILKPNQQYCVDVHGQEYVESVTAADIISWKSGFISLTDQDFPVIARMIERNYDVYFKDKELPDGYKLSGELQTNVELEELLSVLEINLGVKLQRDGREISLLYR